jgi:hypothetical protein
MYSIQRKFLFSKAVSLAFAGSMFLMFTPFEDPVSNSMWPKYLAVFISSVFLAPLLLLKKIKIGAPSAFVLIFLFTIILHTILLRQISFQFDLLIVANCLLAIFVFELSQVWRNEFHSAIRWLIIANVAAILMQALIFFFGTGEIFDIYKFIFGSGSRFSEDYLNIARFSGLQVEPGTYANYVAYLLAIFIVTSTFNPQTYVVSILALLSILLTNSASAIYFAFVLALLILKFWGEKINKIHVIILLFAILIYLSFSNIYEHLTTRFLQNDDGSLSLRMTGIKSYLTTSFENKFIGLGFEHDPCFECHYQDIGVIFNLISSGGILLLLTLTVLFFRSLKKNGFFLAILIFAIVSYAKMHYYELPVWLLFLFSMTKLRRAGVIPVGRYTLPSASGANA